MRHINCFKCPSVHRRLSGQMNGMVDIIISFMLASCARGNVEHASAKKTWCMLKEEVTIFIFRRSSKKP